MEHILSTQTTAFPSRVSPADKKAPESMTDGPRCKAKLFDPEVQSALDSRQLLRLAVENVKQAEHLKQRPALCSSAEFQEIVAQGNDGMPPQPHNSPESPGKPQRSYSMEDLDLDEDDFLSEDDLPLFAAHFRPVSTSPELQQQEFSLHGSWGQTTVTVSSACTGQIDRTEFNDFVRSMKQCASIFDVDVRAGFA